MKVLKARNEGEDQNSRIKQLNSFKGGGGGVELVLAHRVIEKLKMDHLWVYKLYHAATVTESHRQKVRTKIFVLIIWTCFLYGLSRCQIRHEYGLNVTIHKHDRIYSQKDTAERK